MGKSFSNDALGAVVSATLAAGSTTSETMALKDYHKPRSMNNYKKWFWATFQQLDCQEVCTTTQQEYRQNNKLMPANDRCPILMDCIMGKLMKVLNSIKILLRFSILFLVVNDTLYNHLNIMTISTSLIVFISEQICVSFCEKRKRNKQRAEVRRF